MDDFLLLERVERSYGEKRVLAVQELSLREGEVLAVIGPNGSGKSTLLRIVHLLEAPTAGEIIYWDGSRLSDMDRRSRRNLRRQMAMVFQEPLLFRRSVGANISYGLKARGVKREEARERVREVEGMLGLEGLERRYAPTLSGGEAQRVSLARALAVRPRLLLLDEPFASLDSPTRLALRREMTSLLRRLGTTVLYVTHDHHEALEMADRIAVLVEGEVQQVGTPVEIFGKPRNRKVADFIGTENLLEGAITGGEGGTVKVRVKSGTIEASTSLPPGLKVLVVVHPEEVVLLRKSAQAGSARNRLRGKVVDIGVWGPMIKVTMDCGFPLVSYITRSSLEEMGIERGSELVAAFKATSVHLIPRDTG